MSDGGEGLLDVLGGPNRTSVVTGPLGAPVEAAWRIAHRTAVIEMARASGLSLAGGAARQRPARRVDRRHRAAHRSGARRGRAARHRRPRWIGDDGRRTRRRRGPPRQPGPVPQRRAGGRVRRAHSLRRRRRRVRPAEGRQPGPGRVADGAPLAARPALPRRARRRCHRARRRRRGGRPGRRAAALGGRIVPGFELVAEHVDLPEQIAAADAVVTGEGYLDAQSLDGKVVGGVCELAAAIRHAGRRDRRRRRPRRRRAPRADQASASCHSSPASAGPPVRRTALVHRARRAGRCARSLTPCAVTPPA